MNTLEADQLGVHIVCAIRVALQDRDKALKEGKVEDPLHQDYHNSEQLDHLLHVVLSVLQEVVHEDEQTNHGHEVYNSEEHQCPVEEDRVGAVDCTQDAGVPAQIENEIEKELVSPTILLHRAESERGNTSLHQAQK